MIFLPEIYKIDKHVIKDLISNVGNQIIGSDISFLNCKALLYNQSIYRKKFYKVEISTSFRFIYI